MNEIAVRTSGHLTVSADQTWWTEAQTLVLKQAGIDDDVTEAELTGFLHLTQRTGLDPFSRQIYLIGRWDARAQRKVFTPQTAIDGYRVVRDRVIERTHGTLSYDDFLWCGPDGAWHDVWLDDTVPPIAAKVTVWRDGGRFSAVAKYTEYVQTKKGGEPTGMWVKMPASQLAKCAEALALRKAFPHDLAGVYTAEEMAQADNARQNAEDAWTTPAQAVARQQDADAETVVVVERVRDDGPTPDPSTETMITPAQGRMMHAIFNKANVRSRNHRLSIVSRIIGRELGSSAELTVGEASKVIDALNNGALNNLDAPPAPSDEGISETDALMQIITDAHDEDSFETARAELQREHEAGTISGEQFAALTARWTSARNASMAGAAS